MDYETNLKEISEVETEINLRIASLKEELDNLKQKDQDLREALKEAMKSEGIKKYESDFITVTYVPESNRTTIDTKRLKDEKPELWNEYSKTTPVSDSVRIKVKEND